MKVGPKLSHDRHDKLMACLHWYVGQFKTDHPKYARAPHYFDAVYNWFERMNLDGKEQVYTAVEVYNTPREGGAPVALKYAEDLPPVPPWPGL